jgi:hypothetical protein
MTEQQSSSASNWRKLPIPQKLTMWALLTASALLLTLMIFACIQNMINDADGVDAFKTELTADTQELSQLNDEIVILNNAIYTMNMK